MFDVGPLWLAAAGRSPGASESKEQTIVALREPLPFSAHLTAHFCMFTYPISVAHFTVYGYPFWVFFSCHRCHFKVPFIIRNICMTLSLLALPGLVEIIIFNERQTY